MVLQAFTSKSERPVSSSDSICEALMSVRALRSEPFVETDMLLRLESNVPSKKISRLSAEPVLDLRGEQPGMALVEQLVVVGLNMPDVELSGDELFPDEFQSFGHFRRRFCRQKQQDIHIQRPGRIVAKREQKRTYRIQRESREVKLLRHVVHLQFESRPHPRHVPPDYEPPSVMVEYAHLRHSPRKTLRGAQPSRALVRRDHRGKRMRVQVGIEQNQQVDGLAAILQQPRHFEGDQAARGIAAQEIRTGRLNLRNEVQVIGGHRFYVCVRRFLAVQSSCLQRIEWPPQTHMRAQPLKDEHVSADRMYTKKGGSRSVLPNGNKGGPSDLTGLACDDFGQQPNRRSLEQCGEWK